MEDRFKERPRQKNEGYEGMSFNALYGDFNGGKIVPHEENNHNPIKPRTMPVSIDENMTIDEEIEIGASIEL